MAKAKPMKVTTVRFSEDLWAAISTEAALAGLTASQFIREAALARAAASAGARGEMLFASLSATTMELERAAPIGADQREEIRDALSKLSRALSGAIRSESEALRAQSRQARHTASQRAVDATERAAREPAQ